MQQVPDDRHRQVMGLGERRCYVANVNALRLAADRQLWTSYQDQALPMQPRLMPLRRAWDRAAQVGAPLSGVRPGSLVLQEGELREHRERCEVLLVEGADALRHAARAFSELNHVLLLADATGVVTHTAGGGGFEDTARRFHLVPGASWAESDRGTNAIGTVLAEGRAVSVEGAAHWGRRYHDLVCHAAPVVAPDGSVLGVLDATSIQHNADPAIAGTVAAAARALELVLQARAWAGAGIAARRVVESLLDRLPGVGMVVEPGGRIVRANAAGRVWMGAEALPVPSSETLGLAWRELVREALHPTATLETRDRSRPALQLRVEPLLDAAGGVLAVAVYGEPSASMQVPLARRPAGRASPLPRAEPFEAVFAEDQALLDAIGFARRVADSDLAVMLLSETGSGKELFAKAIHAASPRAAAPFVPVNCGSFSPELLESELFGHAPHAFTGAGSRGRDGVLASADAGTLFLDEVAEMPPRMQTALLRFLEDGGYTRVGERARRQADVRVVCATCRDLASLVAQGSFREDLYYRLKSVTITLPPLRDRSDKLALVEHLLGAQAPPVSESLRRWILDYPWPGNVRELKSVLRVVRLLGATAPELDREHLPPDLLSASTPTPEAPVGPLATVEAWAVRRAVDDAGGNVSKAARALGIARSTVYRILRRDRADQSSGSNAS